jgi:hypothetical protein
MVSARGRILDITPDTNPFIGYMDTPQNFFQYTA